MPKDEWGVKLLYPAFAEGDTVAIHAGGDVYARFHLAAPGVAQLVITSPPLKNNAGTPWASATLVTAWVYDTVTGVLKVKLTSLSTSPTGVLTLTDSSILTGTAYRCVVKLSTGEEGMFTATAS
mgnify:CR=1 FL=1